ncbi:hypothetical protein OPQ81_000351 [Rhizoctonia solani]|nr:hypothetical protein OPQ81_000351 [Rhizoctonia solani]
MTCRKRHKKCDLRQPICVRCEKESFPCLGYGFNERKVASCRRSVPRSIRSKLETQRDKNITTTQADAQLNLSSEGINIEPLLVVGGALMISNSPDPFIADLSSTSEGWCEVRTSPQRIDIGPLTTTNQLSTPSAFAPIASSSPSLDQLFSIFTQMSQSPSDPTLAYFNSHQLDNYIMTNFAGMVNYLYFRLMGDQKMHLFTTVIVRLRSSMLGRWVKLLTTKVVEALAGADASKNQFYSRWLGDIEDGVRTIISRDPTSREARELRRDWLEVSVLKTVLIHSSSAYQVLRGAVPTFLQAAYAYPELWLNHSDPTVIPLRSILTSDLLDLASFTLSDTTFAMVFGLPQQLDYDTSGNPPSQ